MKPRARRLLYVEWDDHSSFSASGWRHEDEIKQGNRPVRCRTIGWVVAEDKTALTLCSTQGDRLLSGDQTILKNCIRKKRRLKL